MEYQIFYSRAAEKYLLRLGRSQITTILKRIEYVSSNPFRQDNNIVKLKGTASSYRLRIGDIRVIYQIDIRTKTMYVVKIAPRGSVYS